MPSLARRSAPSAVQRGLSIVELMVGVAIALFITATGATLLANQLRESRRLLLEARLMQDLRAAADLVTRDLRRSGYWGAAADGVWAAGASGVATNPYTALTPTGAASDAASYRYSRDATENQVVDSNEQFGVRLRAQALQLQLGADNWQALTDTGSLTITAFSVTPVLQTVELGSFCAKPCPAGATACPPRQQVRSLAVVISGQLASDAGIKRSVRSDLRLRNDVVTGACAS